NTAICFSLGSAQYHVNNVVIEKNNIHNCGVLPATNQDHGSYICSADNTLIRGNWIHHNADRGVQLYPDADHTEIIGNVIDSNGEGVIFSGGQLNGVYQTADYNTVEHNLITNSQVRQNVESYYGTGEPKGVGNVVSNNCIKGASGSYAGADGAGILSPEAGFTASSNLVADPQYVNSAAGDYALQSGSPCAALLAGGNVDTGSTTPPPPTRTPPPTSTPPSTDSTPTPTHPRKRPRKSRRARARARGAKAASRRS